VNLYRQLRVAVAAELRREVVGDLEVERGLEEDALAQALDLAVPELAIEDRPPWPTRWMMTAVTKVVSSESSESVPMIK